MQHSLLRLLSVAHRERLEVAPLISNLAEEHRGGYRRLLRRLAARLADGTPLVDALEQTPDVLPDQSLLAIRFASQTGTLAPTYEHGVENCDAAPSQARASIRQTVFYTIVTLLILILSVSFLLVFIIPVLAEMSEQLVLDEIGLEMPWSLEAIVTAGHTVSNYAPLFILGLLLIAWLIWSPSSRRFVRGLVPTRWVRGIAQARSAEILRLLSFAVEAGRPLPAAISTLARYHYDKTVRQRLLFARNEMEQGAEVWTSLADAELLTPDEANALAGATSSQSRVWTMRRLAGSKHASVVRRSDTLVAFVQPTVTVLFAVIVLLIASGMIGFLARMIHSFA
jgi:type II secretory pathway component PulF